MNHSNYQPGTGASSSAPSSSSDANAIEAKMQTVEAKLRQERDKARRNYELASERIGLLRTEVESVEKLAKERHQLLSSITAEKKKVEEKLSIRVTVENLTNEFNFQHSEITAKREKLNHMKESLSEASRTRKKKLHDTLQSVNDRRELLNEIKASSLVAIQKDALVDELKDDIIQERFAREWPSFIRSKAKLYEEETAQNDVYVLQNILQRYKEQFGFMKLMENKPENDTEMPDKDDTQKEK